MAFQPLPYRGFRDIYLIEIRGFSSMEALSGIKVRPKCRLCEVTVLIVTTEQANNRSRQAGVDNPE
jgi:hypothetical protein